MTTTTTATPDIATLRAEIDEATITYMDAFLDGYKGWRPVAREAMRSLIALQPQLAAAVGVAASVIAIENNDRMAAYRALPKAERKLPAWQER